MDRYDAKARANMLVNDAPVTPFAMAWRMAHVVNTLVGRPMQVAIVKGLSKKLTSKC